MSLRSTPISARTERSWQTRPVKNSVTHSNTDTVGREGISLIEELLVADE